MASSVSLRPRKMIIETLQDFQLLLNSVLVYFRKTLTKIFFKCFLPKSQCMQMIRT